MSMRKVLLRREESTSGTKRQVVRCIACRPLGHEHIARHKRGDLAAFGDTGARGSRGPPPREPPCWRCDLTVVAWRAHCILGSLTVLRMPPGVHEPVVSRAHGDSGASVHVAQPAMLKD